MSSATASPPSAPPRSDLAQRIHQGEALFIVLLVLSIAGIGVTTFSKQYGFHFWVAMVPLVGGVSAFLAWVRARARGESPAGALRMQAFHWIGTLAALWLVFLLQTAGQIERDALGLIALSTLALATFLAGVYGDWRLCGVGILLGGIVAAAAYVQQLAWVVIVPVLALAVVGVISWQRRGRAPESVADVG